MCFGAKLFLPKSRFDSQGFVYLHSQELALKTWPQRLLNSFCLFRATVSLQRRDARRLRKQMSSPVNYAATWRFSFPRAVSFDVKPKFLDEIDIHVLVVVIQSAPNELPTLPERD